MVVIKSYSTFLHRGIMFEFCSIILSLILLEVIVSIPLHTRTYAIHMGVDIMLYDELFMMNKSLMDFILQHTL